jgi:hypothetical protein
VPKHYVAHLFGTPAAPLSRHIQQVERESGRDLMFEYGSKLGWRIAGFPKLLRYPPVILRLELRIEEQVGQGMPNRHAAFDF